MEPFRKLAEEMFNNMEEATRTDGTKYIRTKKEIEWQRDIILEAHQERMPCDDIYRRVYDLLCDFTECETEEEAQDRLLEIEADVYTSDLTGWLNSDNRNVYYLDEAIEAGCTEGFSLLAFAQKAWIDEIGNTIIAGLAAKLEDDDE